MKLPINIYDAAYLSVFPAAAGMVAYKMMRHGKYRESAPALVGCGLDKEDPAPWKNGSVWVHGVSVGEVIAARAMLPLLREYFHPLPILLTTHTETGQAVARQLPEGYADAVRYYPMDFSWLMRRYVSLYRPRVFIPMETELWPNALDIIRESGSQIFTLNGKISPRSHRRYQKIGSLIRKPLSRITAFCVQTEGDRERIASLLGREDNVHVTGNCKFDVEIPGLSDDDKAALRAELGLPQGAPVVVVGSTHPGEEVIALDAYRQVLKAHPEARLVVVPRHPERFGDVWQLLQASGLASVRISNAERTMAPTAPGVFLVDKMGLLTRLYGLADVAVVAGSFVPGIGGHNILEPAAHKAPVIYGPDMKGQPDMARILSPENGGTVAQPETLGDSIIQLLSQPDHAARKGELGYQAYQANRGSAERNMEIIDRYYRNPM